MRTQRAGRWVGFLAIGLLGTLLSACGQGADDVEGEEDTEEAIGALMTNIAFGKTVSPVGSQVVTDGIYASEGRIWNDTAYAVVIPQNSALVIDLGRVYDVSHIGLQADCNDIYTVSGSSDGVSFQQLTTFGAVSCPGLKTRTDVTLSLPTPARFIKVSPSLGDDLYSVSEVKVLSDVVPCGPTACLNYEVCCNASCGICTASKNQSCTQQVCDYDP